MIDIDGSYGEGGGQLLRMSIALSAITGKPVKVSNIRANRPKPGLAAQHMTSVESIVKICGGDVKGLEMGSTSIEFTPSRISGGDIKLDVGTAGSVELVLQASLLPSLSATNPVNLRIIGGTDVRWSPPFDYFKHVFLQTVGGMGAKADLDMIRRGYYPRGGGEVVAHTEPSKHLKPLIASTRGELKGIRGIAHVSNLPVSIAERMRSKVQEIFQGYGDLGIEVQGFASPKATGKGGALVLWAEFENTILGSSCLAEKGVTSEDVASKACEALVRDIESGCTLDVHCSDQVLPYMALAEGQSTFLVREISNHASTCMWLIRKFLDAEFETEKVGDLYRVSTRTG
jgi:RNA 3'-phosphate cyclase